MKKMQRTIVEGKSIFIGLEDSKRTWKLCVRCEGMIVHETSLPTDYFNLQRPGWPDILCRGFMTLFHP